MSRRWLKPLGGQKVPDIPAERKVSPEQDAGFWSKIWFAWLSPLMDVWLYLLLLYGISVCADRDDRVGRVQTSSRAQRYLDRSQCKANRYASITTP